MRGLKRGTALAGAIIACGAAGMALAQKPPALGEPAPQGGKPQAIQPGPAPAPAPVRPTPQPPPQAAPLPAPGTDKFGQAQTPAPAAPAPQQADKFGASPPAQASPAPATPPPGPPAGPPLGQAAPQTPAPPPPLAAPATPPPANEPDAVRQFRQLLGADAQLSYAASEIIDPARGSVRLREVVLTRPDRRAAIAELTLDGLRENGVTEAILRGVLLQEGPPGARSTDEARIDRVRIAGLTVVRPPPGQQMQPDAITLDALRIEGLRVQGDTPVVIASLSIEDYGKGRPGRIAMEGLEVRTPNQDPIDRVSLGRLTLRGIDLAGTFAALVAKQPPPRTVGAAAIEAEDLALSKGGQRIAGMASMTMSGEAPPAGQPGAETGRIAFRGINVQPFPGIAEWMQRFGYREIAADITMDARIDRGTQRMEIGSFSLAARDIGALGFSMTLDGVNAGETDPAALARSRLVGMRLRFVDQSLYGRFVRMQAQEQRRSEQQVREEFAAQAGALFERPGGARPGPGGKGGGSGGGTATAEIGAAVQRFLRGQAREIEITARPPQPVPFEQLQSVAPAGPDALQQALGLTVTTR